MSDNLQVTKRVAIRGRMVRKLRREGQVPAILYGHEIEPVVLQCDATELSHVIRAGSRIVDLKGAVSEKALIKELQWDTFGLVVLHLDLARVSESELVEVELPVELRGEAPGLNEGGVLEHVLHQVTILCPVVALPEKLEIKVGGLHLNQHITVGQLELPKGAKAVTAADAIVVSCHPPKEIKEVEAGGAAEPEVIGRKEAPEAEAKK